MMQAGMFVMAQSFDAGVAKGIFTHFIREEDPSMTSGRLAEVQVDKVSAEVQAPTAGVIRIIAGAQATVKQEALIAVIE